MKEQVQKTGVRKWSGQDLVDLQSEPLTAITAFFEEYGSCIIKGCDVIPTGSTYTVTPGMVALSGVDQNGQTTFKVAPFAGVNGVTLPIYLTLSYSIVDRPYADLKVKPIAYDFRAAATGVKPTGKPYLEVGVAGGKSFADAIQDANHRFFTDTERDKLKGIAVNANNYVHPAKHPASMIEQDDQNRMVSIAKISEWDAKATTAYVLNKIAELVGSSPAALDTLNELATSLGNDPNFATTVMNALAGKANTGHLHTDLSGVYTGNGNEKPDYFNAGKLRLQMLKGTNVGAPDGWNDVLWMSSYLGGDVKGSNALIFSKYAERIGFARQDFDSKNWGTYREIFHTGNFNPANYATTAHVAQKIAELVASSPAALDTLNELAAALGNDPNFAAKLMNALAGKADVNHKHLWESITNRPTKLSQLTNDLGNYLYRFTIDASTFDQNTYYPVLIGIGSGSRTHIEVLQGFWGSKPSWATHTSGFSLRLIFETNGSEWGVHDVNRNILEYSYRFVNGAPIGGISQMVNSSNEVVYVRGGGRYEFFISNNFTPELKTDSFTLNNQTVAPRQEILNDVWSSASGLGASFAKLRSDGRTVWHEGSFDPGTKAEANHNHDDKYQPKGSYQPAGSYLTQQQLEACFPSGTINPDGSKKEHFLDVICAGMVDSSGSIKDYWGENRVYSYPFAVDKIGNGRYRITHNANTAYYGVLITARVLGNTEYDNYGTWDDRQLNSFVVNMFNDPGSFQDMGFNFVMYRLR